MRLPNPDTNSRHDRRTFLRQATLALAGAGWLPGPGCASIEQLPKGSFKISLAEWSLHRTLLAGQLKHLDFPVVARREYDLSAIELVNQFFQDKARDGAYLAHLKQRADGEGVAILLIMVDGEGALGDADAAQRRRAVETHYPWIEAAHFLGCHSIRVNAATGNVGTAGAQLERVADGLRRLAEYAAIYRLNVLVENHGGLSSNGTWLAGVMRQVNLPNCGTLPDFGNFQWSDGPEYDRYRGVAEMMPWAKAVSAKAHDFDDAGWELHTDYRRMLRIVLAAGYHGFVGIEYEGTELSEPDGIRATKRLLERVRAELTAT